LSVGFSSVSSSRFFKSLSISSFFIINCRYVFLACRILVRVFEQIL
jgi:hypothetical protein